MNSNYDEIQPFLLKSEKVEKQSNEIFSLQGTTLKMRQRNEEDNAGRSVKGRPAGGAFMGRRTFLTYYTLSTTLPTVHYLPTTHCPPLAHYHYLFTPPCPPLAQPVNISENEYWTVYTLPYPSIHTANSARVETQKVLQYLMFAPQCKLCSPYF